MRKMLLASALYLLPSMTSAAETCAIPPSPGATSTPNWVPVIPPATVSTAAPLPAAIRGPSPPGSARRPIAPDAIPQAAALKRIAANGATLIDLGTEHGLRTIFASNGNAFQVFYLAPDGHAVVGGVMWDDAGRNVTRDQVAPIQGTIPTVRIGPAYERYAPEHTPYVLRHTCASWHYALHRDLKLLQAEGGWESTEMLEVYVHLMPVMPAAYRDEAAAFLNGEVDLHFNEPGVDRRFRAIAVQSGRTTPLGRPERSVSD
jgi:hypothetical protein